LLNKILLLIGIIAIIGIGVFIYSDMTAPISTDSLGEPIDIANDPIQTTDTETVLQPIRFGSTQNFFTVKAKYKLSGVLVSTQSYRTGFMDKLAPYDFATCWGKTPEMFPYLKFKQFARFCKFNYKMDAPVDLNYVLFHMSNNHMIPSTLNIRRALKVAKKKELVEIEGYLVYVTATTKNKGTVKWNSSTSRTDKGNGACEIIYVTRLRLGDKVYE